VEQRIYGNRYQVLEKIGMGGMAEVYKATDNTLGRTVALKVMLPQYAADETFAARFRQEAQAAANLQSPYIVNIYDWGCDGDAYYIVMEYVRGTDLKTAIQQRGKIHPRKVAEIASQVCSALSVAHGYDIIHRDIKSANIMVKADGNAKVMDFGIAQAGNSSMTHDSSVLGTAHYVSPEQAQGKELGPGSDLYSLGVVMYEAATGQLPFDGPDVVSVAMKQVNDVPIPPAEINPDIDPQLESIIMRALQKDPRDRFACANDMKKALDAYLAGREASIPTQVIAPAAGGTRMMNPAAVRAEEAKQKKKGKTAPIVIIAIIIALVAGGLGLAYATGMLTPTEKVLVPNVQNMTQEEATTTLEDRGLSVGTITQSQSDTVSEGHVMSQDPAMNSSVAKDTTVNLVVSSGKTTPKSVQVPNLIGLTASEAEQQLSAAGLKGSSKSDYSESFQQGQVFKQEPTANSQTTAGSTVTYTISSGKESKNVTVPSVIGTKESSAKSTLEGLGLNVKTEEGTSETVGKGEVCQQSIEAGTSVSSGSTITITVSKGSSSSSGGSSSSSTSVPDVTGMKNGEATAALKNAGFEVKKQYAAGTEDEVLSQDPTSGSKASSGSTVIITLGTGGN
jgi:eukaryotic-like serine/threonine-protein kinase